jgi:hypothetical protein
MQTILRNADHTTSLCAMGGSPEIFQFYASSTLIIPDSAEKAQQLLDTSTEIRCVYYKVDWESPVFTKIGDFLFEHAETEKLNDIFVFKYQPHSP